MNKSDFKTEFFNAVLQVAKMEGFSILRWTRSSSHMYLKKELEEGLLVVTLYLDNKYLPRIEGHFAVYHQTINELLFKQILLDENKVTPDKEGWRCAANDFGSLLSGTGVLSTDHRSGTSFELSDTGFREAIDFVKQYYFELGANLVAAHLCTLKKIDTLINSHIESMNYPDEAVRLPYFMYSPYQAITGTLLACIHVRSNRQKLVEYHTEDIENWSGKFQNVLAKIINYYVGEGVLSPTPKLNAALMYLR